MESPDQFLKFIQSRLNHENELLNHRLTWMWALQGLLLTAFAVLTAENNFAFAAITVAVVGAIASVSIGYSLVEGKKYLDCLNQIARKLDSSQYRDQYERVGIRLPDASRFQVLMPWNLLPWLFAVVWIVLAIYVCSFTGRS